MLDSKYAKEFRRSNVRKDIGPKSTIQIAFLSDIEAYAVCKVGLIIRPPDFGGQDPGRKVRDVTKYSAPSGTSFMLSTFGPEYCFK